MKAQEYIKKHPRSMLAAALADLPADTEIVVGSGTIAPDSPRSNLGALMVRHNATAYRVGGRAGLWANDGYHFAVIVK